MQPTEQQAEAIAAVLRDTCGWSATHKGDEEYFVRYVTTSQHVEYRFCGALGLGGKFHIANGGRWFVSCYPEDRTFVRDTMIQSANRQLDAMRIRAAIGE